MAADSERSNIRCGEIPKAYSSFVEPMRANVY